MQVDSLVLHKPRSNWAASPAIFKPMLPWVKQVSSQAAKVWLMAVTVYRSKKSPRKTRWIIETPSSNYKRTLALKALLIVSLTAINACLRHFACFSKVHFYIPHQSNAVFLSYAAFIKAGFITSWRFNGFYRGWILSILRAFTAMRWVP